MEEYTCSLDSDQVNLNVVLFHTVLQNDATSLQEVLIVFKDLLWDDFKALVHGVECQFPLLPVLMLTLLHNDCFALFKVLSCCTQVHIFAVLEATLTDVHDVDGLASSEHLGERVTSFARHRHHILLLFPRLCLIHFDFAFDLEYLLFDQLASFFWQLG